MTIVVAQAQTGAPASPPQTGDVISQASGGITPAEIPATIAAKAPQDLLHKGIEFLSDGYDTGGPVVAILAVISLFALTICLIKLGQYWSQGIGKKGKSDQIVEAWLAGNSVEARLLANSYKTVRGRILTKALHALSLEEGASPRVREDIERIAIREIATVRTYLRALDNIVQVTPLLGLFGTVLGMIEAFQKLQTAGSDVDPAILAGGIWVALLTTACGLAVAMPTSLVLSWLEGRLENESRLTEDALTGLFTGQPADQTREIPNVVPQAAAMAGVSPLKAHA